MREIDAELQARLDGGATRMCRAWRLERRDGVVLGFTDHDRALVIDGERYEAASGLTAGAIQAGLGLSVDNAEAVGALTSDGITEADIAAGLYDGASVRMWLVDWERTDLRVPLFTGRIGEITRGNGRFEAELRSVVEDLGRPTGRALLAQCDAELGDARCGVDLETPVFRTEAVVTGRDAAGLLLAELPGYAPGWFAGGTLEWSDGRRMRIRRDEARAGARLIALQEPVDVAVGETVVLRAGCDKREVTCREKFGNFVNFRGFPHIPGSDWLTSYPNQGEGHDGGSLRKG